MSTSVLRRIAGAAMVIALMMLFISPAAAAAAQTDDQARNDLVVLSGGATVDAGTEIDTVVVFDGDVTVDGTVTDSVVAFNGDVTITGSVDKEVVAVNGRAIVEQGATVSGDVVSSDAPRVDGTVGGEVRNADFGDFSTGAGILMRVAWWLAVTVSTLVLGLAFVGLFPRAVDSADRVFRSDTASTIGWGAAIMIVIPVLIFVAFVTLVGIPLALMAAALLAGFAALGYVTCMYLAGRAAVPEGRPAMVAFLVGWLSLRALDLIPFVGGVITAFTVVVGLGSLAIAGWRAGRSPVAVARSTRAADPAPTRTPTPAA